MIHYPKIVKGQDGKHTFARFSDRDYLIVPRPRRVFDKEKGEFVQVVRLMYRAVSRPATNSEMRKLRAQGALKQTRIELNPLIAALRRAL